MIMNATQLRKDVYRTLDRVLKTGGVGHYPAQGTAIAPDIG